MTALIFIGVAVVLCIACFFLGRYVYHPVAVNVETRRLVDRLAIEVLVKEQADLHDAYEHERVHVRKRPKWHKDQRLTAISQRVVRELHKRGLHTEQAEVMKVAREVLQ